VPPELRAEAEALSREIGSLLQPALSLVRENPGFTPADYRDLGLAIRQMRNAVKLSHYHFSEIEVLHDEGRVLGVEPPRQWERDVGPSEAASVFGDAARMIRSILELAPDDVTVHGAPIPSPALPDRQNYRPGTAFIIMSMDPKNPELDDVCNAVKRCFAEYDIKAVRADDIEHEDLITARIIEEIRTAEFLFADLTGERPSLYYELGFAHAIKRPVMLYRKEGTRIHFDVAGYNCPEYKNLTELEKKLRTRLESVTGRTGKNPHSGAAINATVIVKPAPKA
jgi:hypothetical protein